MLSVLLPARDAGRTLDTALDSLRSQTLAPARVLVVDDGSVDSTAELLESWRRRWPVVTTLRTPGQGIARALNLGLEWCLDQGDCQWIARMDADDRCHPERFARQLEAARADTGAALLGCEVSHWGGGADFEGMRRHIDWANALHLHEELAQALWIDSPLPHPTWLVRRDAYELVGRYDESQQLPEDYDWLHRFFEHARGVPLMRALKCAGIPLLDWAESPRRLTRTSSMYSETAFNRVKARSLANLLARRDPTDVYVFGLGPKSKALFPWLKHEIGHALKNIVEVHPRRAGIDYQGVRVVGVDEWRASIASGSAARPLVLVCVGTPEARASCERLCIDSGLVRGDGFLSL